jgi:hypothetical protein
MVLMLLSGHQNIEKPPHRHKKLLYRPLDGTDLVTMQSSTECHVLLKTCHRRQY